MASSRQLATTATTLTRRISDLIQADVMMVDSEGEVIAVSTNAPISEVDASAGSSQFDYLAVDVDMDGHVARVLVGTPRSTALTSPKVARSLIQMMVTQRLPHGGGRHEDRELQTSMLLMQMLRRTDGDGRLSGHDLDLDLAIPRVVFVVRADSFISSARAAHAGYNSADIVIDQRAQLALTSLRRYFPNRADVPSGYIGGGELVSLVPIRDADLAPWLGGGLAQSASNATRTRLALDALGSSIRKLMQRSLATDVTVGIGRHYVGEAGLARSYRDARLAANLGSLIEGSGHVHSMHNIGVKAFMSCIDEHLKADLAQQILSPMQQYPELLETLEVYFDLDCYQSDVARALSIHRNTLTYRLAKAQEYSGLDPRCFDDAVQLRLALQLRKSRREG